MAYHAVVADDEVDLSRRKFLTRATIATGAVGAAFAAVPFIESWNPSERARAQGAPTELDLFKLEPGQMATTIWRKSPIYVVRRTPDMVTRIAGHDELLKDPKSYKSEQPAYSSPAPKRRFGRHPRCVQVPISTRNSALRERSGLRAYGGCSDFSDFGTFSNSS